MSNEPALRFLDSGVILPTAATQHLLESIDQTSPFLDFSDWILVVPTRQAGRILRQSLAREASKENRALRPPKILLPADLIPKPKNEAKSAECQLAWVHLLTDNSSVCKEARDVLFPSFNQNPWNFSFALNWAEQIISTRKHLASEASSIQNVLLDGKLHEREERRMRALATLEDAYLNLLAAKKLSDPVSNQLNAITDTDVSAPDAKIAICGVTDLSPLYQALLQRFLKENGSIEIWIHSPENSEQAWTRWGTPKVDFWTSYPIHFNTRGRPQLRVENYPGQCMESLKNAFKEVDNLPLKWSLGWVSEEDTPYLETHLGSPIDSPAGRSWASSRLGKLVTRWLQFATDPSIRKLNLLLELPDFLSPDTLKRDLPDRVEAIRLWRKFQSEALPVFFDHALVHRLRNQESSKGLIPLIDWIWVKLEEFRSDDISNSLESFLTDIYCDHQFRRNDPGSEAMLEGIQKVKNSLSGLEQNAFREGLSSSQQKELFLKSLLEQRIQSEQRKNALQNYGWLELPWVETPGLIVGPFSEENLPFDPGINPLLPRGMQEALGFRGDSFFHARDAALLESLISSRKESGGIVTFYPQRTSGGNPSFPSRLLFQIPDEELPDQIRFLTEHKETPPLPPWETGMRFQLPQAKPLKKIRVTDISNYLNCPFTFYLQRLLGTCVSRAQRRELDALDFGSLAHEVLERWAKGPHKDSDQPQEIFSDLDQLLSRIIKNRFGNNTFTTVALQVESLRRRLKRFANQQASWREEGWRIQQVEFSFPEDFHLNGIPISGKIDRVDYNESLKEWALLDYKTSDRANPPEKVHIKGFKNPTDPPSWQIIPRSEGKKIWCDLQLPIYAQAWLKKNPEISPAQMNVGYVQLPKSLEDIGFSMWTDDSWNDDSIGACVEGVFHAINESSEWPLNKVANFSDFPELWHQRFSEVLDPLKAPSGNENNQAKELTP